MPQAPSLFFSVRRLSRACQGDGSSGSTDSDQEGMPQAAFRLTTGTVLVASFFCFVRGTVLVASLVSRTIPKNH